MSRQEKKGPWTCYCLHNNMRYTYVGITNNFARRHRQHNGELVGGAKYTAKYRPWSTLFKIEGLMVHRHVLQLEWAMKHKRARGPGTKGSVGRIRTLEKLLNAQKWTSKSPLMSTLKLTVNVYGISLMQYLKCARLMELPNRPNVAFRFI